MKKIVVIGGGAAGAKAASKAKSLDKTNIVELYTDENQISVSLCGLPYYIEGVVDDINKLIIKTPEDFYNKEIAVFLNHTLEEINPNKNYVIINGIHIFYDELILGLGARVNIPNIENIDANNIFSLRSIDSALKIREKMLDSKTVLIVGGGYIALELTEAFVKNGLKVIIVEAKNRLLSDFDEEFSDFIKNYILEEKSGKIEVHCSCEISKIMVDENNNFKSAVMNEHNEYSADFCVLCTGANPNVEVARKAGIKLGSTGAIYVDNKMRTNFENIYACGDCTEKFDIITHQPTYIGLGTIANKEGRVAGINATGLDKENFDGILTSTITKFFDYTISKTGLTVNKAKSLVGHINIEPVSSTIIKKDKAGYMPNSSEMLFKLVADKRSGEILGAQSIGRYGNIAQRINTVTTALKTRTTVEDLLYLDLPYAPPFSGSIDPVLTASYQLKSLLDK